MARLVLSDTSPLVGLCRVDGLIWLHELFGSVDITEAVRCELERGGQQEASIGAALDQGWLRVRQDTPAGASRPPHLGEGEWSTIRTAVQHQEPVLVLMDDRLARREARAAGLLVAGTAAVVVMAQRRGLVASARKVFEKLLQSDFRISAKVIQAALDSE